MLTAWGVVVVFGKLLGSCAVASIKGNHSLEEMWQHW